MVYVNTASPRRPERPRRPPARPRSIGYDAFAVLQQGIDVVANGGTVHVAAGEYAGADAATATKNITLVRRHGRHPCRRRGVTVTGLTLNTGDTLR